MKLCTKFRCSGMTLVEMLMSIGCGALILAALVTAGVAMQRSYGAVESYSNAEGDQLRVLDYVAMDCRRATTTAITTVNSVYPTLQLTLPVYYSSVTSSATANQPTLTSGALSYGSGSITINYQQSGSTFTREVIVKNSGGTVTSDNTSTIAKKVSSFTITPLDQSATNGTVTCSLMFFPTFLKNTGTGSWRSGGSAPANTLGSNGDWYVIDPTAGDSTVGDVYYKSSGSYSKVENEKATQVYCNTFLRNAVARQ
jgi:hypothetical protein